MVCWILIFAEKETKSSNTNLKYENGVAHIITFGKLKARMALRDVGRVLGLSYGYTIHKICK